MPASVPGVPSSQTSSQTSRMSAVAAVFSWCMARKEIGRALAVKDFITSGLCLVTAW